MIPDRLLKDRITIRKPVQSFVPGSKKPVFQFQTAASDVKARFNPANTGLDRNVLGQNPKKQFRLFLNPTDLSENDEVVNEETNEVYLVTEVKNFFNRHLEAFVQEKK